MKWSLFAAALLPAALIGCDDDPAAPNTGAIEVTIATDGAGTDADGFVVTLNDDDDTLDADVDDTVTFEDVEPGSHEVELTELADNCTVDGDNPETVTVQAGGTATVSFDITCTGA